MYKISFGQFSNDQVYKKNSEPFASCVVLVISMIRQIYMAMNEGQGKLREVGIKYVGNVLFVKANLLVQTFM